MEKPVSAQLLKVRRMERKQIHDISREERPVFHMSSPTGWINDPNGLCWFQGYYHLFYQHNPHGQEWSNMYWGHAASPDLIHWTHLPLVLAPQEEILENPKSIPGFPIFPHLTHNFPH